MKKLYANYDGLDVAFQCRLPLKIREQLAEAKAEALEDKKALAIALPGSGKSIEVQPHGGPGGYLFAFSTGKDGEMWFVKNSDKKKDWNVYVSVSSLNLALNGFEHVKNKLKNMLELMGAEGEGRYEPVTNTFTEEPLESISRFDFCIDYLSNTFEPDANQFITHSRTTKKSIAVTQVDRGKEVESITVGKMPNRQVTIYNKTAEIKVHNKLYWYNLWGIQDPEQLDGKVWRIEVRAGKEELKKWNVKRFDQLEQLAGNIVESTLKGLKYTEEDPYDSNRSRWPLHPMWASACQAVHQALQNNYSSGAKRLDILHGLLTEKIERYEKGIMGNLISYSALTASEFEAVPEALDKLVQALKDQLFINHNELRDKFIKAQLRCMMLE